MEGKAKEKRLLLIIHSLTVFYMFSLFIFAATAFPLESELGLPSKSTLNLK